MALPRRSAGVPPILELAARDLQAILDRNEDLFILDVRNTDEFAAWKIESRRPLPMRNVPYVYILATTDADDLIGAAMDYAQREWAGVLPRDRTILVVCARGESSAFVAEGLRRLGYAACNLQGGMVAWGNSYDFRPVVESAEVSIYQVIRPARGCLSYVAVSGGEAVVIDPLRHAGRYLEFARSRDLRIVRILDTHGHADHISGGPALAAELNVPYHFHPYDAIHPIDVLPATVAFAPLWGGQEFQFGTARLQALHVPGHTLGNIVYLLNGRYLFSGDSIFIESVARPDLGGRGEAWSPMHHASITRLLALPDQTVVLPGHFSHPAEANGAGLYAATLGRLKQANEGLRMVQQGKEAFVAYLLASLPTFPPQYVDIKRVNAGLLAVDEEKASELELGRNICALAPAYRESP